ncbi:helix-turn-helix domain-containing protein [Flavobacterium sp. WC2409]|uniref:Helix-turn-helix domain-containing protein n=2 Tax=unclassified Flavobacterium TaxID=196869 RepID=A0AB39WDQ0_9FLAO
MNQQQFLSAFKNLQSEVQEIKTLQQRVLLYLENNNGRLTEDSTIMEERITVKESCQILKCSEVTLWKLRKGGILPYTQHKRTIRFKKSDILNYLNQKG